MPGFKPFSRGFAMLLLASSPALLLAAGTDDRQKLTTECEVAVALSAAPTRLRESASVYALQNGKYRKVVEGEGPLTCVVERNHAEAIIPQCMDRAGVDSVLPAIIARSMMSLDGASFMEIETASQQKLDEQEFKAAPRAGVSYMMSAYNYIYTPSAKRVLKVPPHVMFYAPDVTNEDIGGAFESMVSNIGTPFILNEGPHGYMITYTQFPASPDDVAEKCRGQLGEAPPAFDPFPKG
jgi:hypothetical protein